MNNSFTPNKFLLQKNIFFGFLPMLFLLLFGQFGYSQVSTYSYSESVSSYTALATSTTAYTAPWDDHVSGSAFLAPIGFNFVYDGITQTQCFISPNGFITFGVQPATNNYIPLSVAISFTNGGAISALGMDLISGTPTDNIVYSTVGTSPNRVFVVQWTNARRKSTAGNFNFQIRLVETTNVIELSYGSSAPIGATAINSQVGIRGITNVFLQGEVNNRLQSGVANTNLPWSGKTTSGTANSSTVRTSVTEYPNDGLKYTYTPSIPCTTPIGAPSGLSVGTTSVTSTSFVGNSFTAAVPAPTNYLILRSTVNIAPTSIVIPNRVYYAVNNVISGTYTVVSISDATFTSFTQTGLTPNTVYYYWVIPYNSGCFGGPFYNISNMITTSKTTCISQPLSVASSLIAGNSFTASWNAVAGATDYAIDVSTSNTFSTFLPGYSNASTSGATSLSIVGLNPLTTYFFRVRAVGLNCNTNSLTGTATTTCGAFPIPYFQNFDTTPVNTLPTCFTVANDNADGVAWQVQNTLPASSPNSYHLATNTASTNDWFFTPGLNLLTGVTYRLKFKYNTLTAGLFSEDLKVRIGSGASAAGMNITLLDFNFVNTVYQTAIVDFFTITDGVFYLGFQGNSSANQSKILIDDISVIVSPTCFEPDNIVVNSVGPNNVIISWEPPLSPPSNGYDYYVSTSNAQPATTATPTGSVGSGVTTANIIGLSAATLYYIWVRGNCGASDSSVWSLFQSFSTDCSTPELLNVTDGVLCGGGSTTLTATANPGSVIEWFADSAGLVLLGTGNSFVTPTLSATTSYWAQSKAPGGLVTVGPISPLSHGGSLGTSTTLVDISFSVFTATNLQSIDIYPMVSGQSGTFTIKNSSNLIIASYPYFTSVAGGNTPQTINFNIDLTPGSYSLSTDVIPSSGLLINVDNNNYSAYTSSIANLLGNSYDSSAFMYAYNWKFSNICRSLLTPVTATITAAPSISLSQTSSTICSGESTPLITVLGSTSLYNNFIWSPSSTVVGSIGAGYTLTPTITTNYTLTASQSSGSFCLSTLNYTVTVNAEPPPISVSPATSSICQGQTQLLTSSLATATQVTIYEETFNGANSWTTYNSSIGGIIANSEWTLRNSTYSYVGTWSGGINLSSNDASRFYFTNSDAQGGPVSNRTRTYLESPAINLAAYNTASLNFWHYLRLSGGNRARVEASIDDGTTWTTVVNFVSTTSSLSTPNFTNVTVSLNSLLGNSSVKFRFYFDAQWGYGWAIDNFKITGNLALEVNWSPVTDLYFDSAGTTQYIAGTPASIIYSKPNSTITYTGTALGANGCSTSASSTITVIPSVITGTLSNSQDICANWSPTALNLAGSIGPIVRWEFATNPTFTLGLTTIANTTTSLAPSQIGTFTGTRYYRVVFQSGSCPLVYSNSVYINYSSTTWNGTTWSNGLPNNTTKAVFNVDFSSTANIQACSVEVISGTVIFNTGHTLTVQNDVKVSGGSLTFDNNASLVQVNTLDNNGVAFSNTGNITYKRATTPLFKFDYTYWSTPVSPQILLDVSPLSPTNLFLQFNSITNSWQYINSPGTTTMEPGKGYIFRAPTNFPTGAPSTPQVYIANFIGVPNTGTISIPTVGGANQFNLLGNPYPSAISADAFLLDASNAATLSGSIYLWTHNTPLNAAYQYSGSDYAIYNYLGGIVGGVPTSAATNPGLNIAVPSGKIASGQGFFIKGLTSGTATFKNTMRIVGNNDQFFKMNSPIPIVNSEPEKHRYWLNIFNTQGAFKQTLLGYVEGATFGLDRLFDGEMVDVGNVITFYSMYENTKLSIQGRPLPFDVNDTIPLGYKSTIASTYSIAMPNYDGLFITQNIYLEDKALNIIHDLKSGPYTFSTNIGTFDNRFVLRYTNETLGFETPVFNENTVVIYKNNPINEFVVSSGTTLMSYLKVFDIRGSLLLEKKNINALQTNFSVGQTNQVLLVQVISADGIIVTKRVIN